MRKAVGAARREFFTSSGHYAKDVAKSAAEKVVNGRYAHNKLLTSFTAVFPMDKPQYLVLVMLFTWLLAKFERRLAQSDR